MSERPVTVGEGDAAVGAEPGAGAEQAAGGGADRAAATGAEPQSYETASARVEEIVRRLDSGQAGLRETLDLVREGRSLIEFCAHELDAVGGDLEELRLDELVARLERDHGGAA